MLGLIFSVDIPDGAWYVLARHDTRVEQSTIFCISKFKVVDLQEFLLASIQSDINDASCS